LGSNYLIITYLICNLQQVYNYL